MSSVSGLLVPNNFDLYIKGRQLKSVDFELTAAELIAGTAKTIVTLPVGQMAAVENVVARKLAGTAYTGAGVVDVLSDDLNLTIVRNGVLASVNAAVSSVNNFTLQDMISSSAGTIQVGSVGGLAAGDAIVQGTIWYYVLPVVA